MRSYSSRFYDQYFVGVEGDVAFYAGHARCSSGPILEVGCGSGRITLPLARAGAKIVGISNMALLRSDRVNHRSG